MGKKDPAVFDNIPFQRSFDQLPIVILFLAQIRIRVLSTYAGCRPWFQFGEMRLHK
jgi:hypothetical protein